MKIRLFGRDVVVDHLSLACYGTDQRPDTRKPLAVVAHLNFGDGIERQIISVNIEGSKELPDGVFYAKSYSELKDMFTQFISNGVIEIATDIPAKETGYVKVPACRLTALGKTMLRDPLGGKTT